MSPHDTSRPLVIYIPPFFQTESPSPTPLPEFLKPYPLAVINYRWLDPASNGHIGSEGPGSPFFQWPCPLHDTLFGYSWITANLAPLDLERRDVYVYGSYLGATLAAALSLTESHPHQRMAIRGFLTFNGIYNWTTFLPDHPIHRHKSFADVVHDQSYAEGSFFRYLRDQMTFLFRSPSDLFDPFASPSLFFHNPGMLVPEDFSTSALSSSMSNAIDALSSSSEEAQHAALLANNKIPRKGYLTFPPGASTLKLPEALLMYETPPPLTTGFRGPRQRVSGRTKRKPSGLNNFQMQTRELGELMQRSINKYELKERLKWGDDMGEIETEAAQRVQMRDVGAVEGNGELGDRGQEVAAAWLQERVR